MSAEELRDLSNLVLIIGLVGAALGTFGINRYSAKVSNQEKRLQEARQAREDNHASELTAKIDSLMSDTKTLQKRLSPFEDVATRRYPGASVDQALSRLRSEVSQLDRRTEGIESSIAPRHLRPEHATQLRAALRSSHPIPITMQFPPGDTEAHAFAVELGRALTAAGWPAREPVAALLDRPCFGLRLLIGEAQSSSEAVSALQRALDNIGLDATAALVPDLTAEKVIVFVGKKP